MRIGVRALRAAVVAAVTAGALVGCSTQPGVAAVVDGERITQAELNRATEQLRPILDGAEPTVVLVALLLAPAFVDVAAERGVAVSEQAAVEVMDSETAARGGAEVEEWSPESIEVIQLFLANQALQGVPDGMDALAEAEQRALSADVEVNPRYGQIDPETGQITQQTPPWIVQAAPTAP